MAALIRYGIIAMLLLGLGSVVYVWMAASSTPNAKTGIKSFAAGKMKSLQFDEKIRTQMAASPIVDAAGKELSLYDFDTEIIVLNLWYINCPPCVYEMPTLGDLQDRYPEERLKVVTVSFDRPSEHLKAQEKLKQLAGGRLPFYGAPNGRLLQDTKMYGFPTTIIYRKSGCEVGRISGDAEWASPDAIKLFDALLANPNLRNDCKSADTAS